MRRITIVIICLMLITTFSYVFPIKITVALPPYEPRDPGPSDGSYDVSIETDLNWTGGDPDQGDKVTYDVYFGTSESINQVEFNDTDLIYDPPGTLAFSTLYFWKVVAWDNHGESTPGETWSFHTQPESGYIITTTMNGTGSGTIEASPPGPYTYGTVVTVWANASINSTFTGFSGDLMGMTSPQTLVINGNKSVNAQFTLKGPYTLTLTMSGTGSGTIQASPAGPYTYGTVVTVWANASINSTFTGFSGDLTGSTSPQILVMNGNKSVNAQFSLQSGFSLTLTSNGTGNGTIQVSPGGPYTYGDVVTVWANASIESIFTGFFGGLSGTTSPQDLIIYGNTTVNAEFTFRGPYTLTLMVTGTGTGTIQANASSPFYYGDVVRIWANASIGSTFSGFSGALTGKTSPQSLFMNGNKSVTATFKKNQGTQEEPQNIKPIADASAGEPYQGYINDPITFDGSKSDDIDGSITKWFWLFGDNTNGIGEIVTHTYTEPGTYTVTLTVTDNEEATSTSTTTCMIVDTSNESNRPPFRPIISGPLLGTKNTYYIYTAVSTDPDNDSLIYTFQWGGSFSNTSEVLPSGDPCYMNHSWMSAGRYNLTVTVTDNKTESSSKMNIYIDAVQTRGAGYLLDNDGDGVYDAFYSDETQQIMSIDRNDDGSYLIDKDGDGNWDYVYNETYGLTSYQEPRKTPGFELVFVFYAIAVGILIWRKKRIM